jgi:phospholipid N-methyltransferase
MGNPQNNDWWLTPGRSFRAMQAAQQQAKADELAKKQQAEMVAQMVAQMQPQAAQPQTVQPGQKPQWYQPGFQLPGAPDPAATPAPTDPNAPPAPGAPSWKNPERAPQSGVGLGAAQPVPWWASAIAKAAEFNPGMAIGRAVAGKTQTPTDWVEGVFAGDSSVLTPIEERGILGYPTGEIERDVARSLRGGAVETVKQQTGAGLLYQAADAAIQNPGVDTIGQAAMALPTVKTALLPKPLMPVLNAMSQGVESFMGAIASSFPTTGGFLGDVSQEFNLAGLTAAARDPQAFLNRLKGHYDKWQKGETSFVEIENSLATESKGIQQALGEDFTQKYKAQQYERDPLGARPFMLGEYDPATFATYNVRHIAFTGRDARVNAMWRIQAGEDPDVVLRGLALPAGALPDEIERFQTKTREFMDARARIARAKALAGGASPQAADRAAYEAQQEAGKLINATGFIPGEEDPLAEGIGNTAVGMVLSKPIKAGAADKLPPNASFLQKWDAGAISLDLANEIPTAKLFGVESYLPKAAAKKQVDWLTAVYDEAAKNEAGDTMKERVDASLSGLTPEMLRQRERAQQAADKAKNPLIKAVSKAYVGFTQLAEYVPQTRAHVQDGLALDVVNTLVQDAASPNEVVNRLASFVYMPEQLTDKFGNVPISVKGEIARPVVTDTIDKIAALPSMQAERFNPIQFLAEYEQLSSQAARKINNVLPMDQRPKIEQLASSVKQWMGEFYLRNPGYIIRNAISDTATVAQDGLLVRDSVASMNDYLGKFGIRSQDIVGGKSGFDGELVNGAQKSKFSNVPVLGAIQNKLGDINEGLETGRRVRAFGAAFRQWWGLNWKPSVSDTTRAQLGPEFSGAVDSMEAAWRSGKNPQEMREAYRKWLNPTSPLDTFNVASVLEKAGVDADSISPEMHGRIEAQLRLLADKGARPEEFEQFFKGLADEAEENRANMLANIGDIINPRKATQAEVDHDMSEFKAVTTDIANQLVRNGVMDGPDALRQADQIVRDIMANEQGIREARANILKPLIDAIGGAGDLAGKVDVNKLAQIVRYAMDNEFGHRGTAREAQAKLVREAWQKSNDASRRGATARTAGMRAAWDDYRRQISDTWRAAHQGISFEHGWATDAIRRFTENPAAWDQLLKEQPKLADADHGAKTAAMIEATRKAISDMGAEAFDQMVNGKRYQVDYARRESYRTALAFLKNDPNALVDTFDILIRADQDVVDNATITVARNRAELQRKDLGEIDLAEYDKRVAANWEKHFEFARKRHGDYAQAELVWAQVRNGKLGQSLRALGYTDEDVADMFAKYANPATRSEVVNVLAKRVPEFDPVKAWQVDPSEIAPRPIDLTNPGPDLTGAPPPADPTQPPASGAPAPVDPMPPAAPPAPREAAVQYLRGEFAALPDEQFDTAIKVFDARAEAWAKVNGKTADDWYQTRIATAPPADAGGPTMAQDQPAGRKFYTSRGSEYTIDANGNTTRFKRSPGPGQGEMQDAMPAVFLAKADADRLLPEIGQARIFLAERQPDGSLKQVRPEQGYNVGQLGDAVIVAENRADGTQKVFPASKTPEIGLSPFEISYKGDQKTTHLGHEIVGFEQPATVRSGSVTFLDDGSALIRAMESPDVSTLLHEAGHIFRRDMDGPDVADAARWAGAADNGDGTFSWDIAAEEKFARGFEDYLREGNAPTEGLRGVFDKLKTWIASIYAKLRGVIDTGLTDDMRGVYDRLLSGEVRKMAPPADADAYIAEEMAKIAAAVAPQMAPEPSAVVRGYEPPAPVEAPPVEAAPTDAQPADMSPGPDQRFVVPETADQMLMQADQAIAQREQLTGLIDTARQKQGDLRQWTDFGRLAALKETADVYPSKAEIARWLNPDGSPRRMGNTVNWLESQGGGRTRGTPADKLIEETMARYGKPIDPSGNTAQEFHDFLLEARRVHREIAALESDGKRAYAETSKAAEDAFAKWQDIINELERRRDALDLVPLEEADLRARVRTAYTAANGSTDDTLASLADYMEANPEQAGVVFDVLQELERPAEPLVDLAPIEQAIAPEPVAEAPAGEVDLFGNPIEAPKPAATGEQANLIDQFTPTMAAADDGVRERIPLTKDDQRRLRDGNLPSLQFIGDGMYELQGLYWVRQQTPEEPAAPAAPAQEPTPSPMERIAEVVQQVEQGQIPPEQARAVIEQVRAEAEPQPEAPKAPTFPPGVDAAEVARMDREIQRLEERAAKLNKKANAPQVYPGSYVTGSSGRSKSFTNKTNAESERRAITFGEWQKVDADLKELKALRAAYAAGEVWTNGQKRADAPSRQRAQSADEQIATYLRATLKPGDLISVGGGAPLAVKKVNAKSITTESGTNWKYSEVTPVGADGKEIARRDFARAVAEFTKAQAQPPQDAAPVDAPAPVVDAAPPAEAQPPVVDAAPPPAPDAAPTPAPAADVAMPTWASRTGPMTLDDHSIGIKLFLSGEPTTADQWRAEFERFVASKEQVMAELNAKTVKELAPNGAGGMKKAEIVRRIWNNAATRYLIADSYQVDVFNRETTEAAIGRSLASVTDEQMVKYQNDRKEARAARQKALTNPETLAEFNEFISRRGIGNLSDEQRARYDEQQALAERRMREAYAPKPAPVAKLTPTATTAGPAGVNFSMIETTHKKNGTALYVVQMDSRVERDAYNAMNAEAKRLGGWYSNFVKSEAGFTFKTREAATQFMEQQGAKAATPAAPAGDAPVQDAAPAVTPASGAMPEAAPAPAAEPVDTATITRRNRAQAMIELAEKMEQDGAAKMGADRKTNTAKRAREAGYAEERARDQMAMARTIRNIAGAIESGDAVQLAGISARTQIEEIDRLLRGALWRRNQAENIIGMAAEGRQPDQGDAKYVRFPTIRIYDMGRMIDGMEAAPGYKAVAKQLAKRWAATAGMPQMDRVVVFESQGDIELYEKVIEYQTKVKGKSAAFVPGMDDYTARKRLQAAGIYTDAQVRAAAREYLTYKEGAEKPDAIKQLERSLVGSKIAGYFPTPAGLAGELVQRADIQPGMRVLEPEAGKGSIADIIRREHPEAALDVIEYNNTLREVLAAKGYTVAGNDMLAHTGQYDRIVMNPPFENGQDIDHVRKAFDLLAPGGKLVAIMSRGPFFRSDGKATEFRTWLEDNGGIYEDLPDGSFLTSDRSTGVATSVVEITKSAAQAPKTLYQERPMRSRTDTPEFRNWFGESVVRDERGQPLRMLHGTSRSGFDAFDKKYLANNSLYGPGFYFTDDAGIATGDYRGNEMAAPGYTEKSKDVDYQTTRLSEKVRDQLGTLTRAIGVSTEFLDNTMTGRGAYPVHLSIQKPFDMEGSYDASEVARIWGGRAAETLTKFLGASTKQLSGKRVWDIAKEILGPKGANDALARAGYDGITHIGGQNIGTRDHRVYIAFDETQIKSVFNKGAWSKDDRRIMYQERPAEEVPPTDENVTPETLARQQNAEAESGKAEGIHFADMLDAATGQQRKAFGAIKAGFDDHMKAFQPGERPLTREQRKAIEADLARLQRDYYEHLSAGKTHARERTNFALTDYAQKRGADKWLSLVAPFSYWATRQGRNYALRFMQNPSTLAAYWRMREAIEKENRNQGRRGRFARSIQVPGTNTYIDPMSVLFPFSGIFGGDIVNDPNEAQTAMQRLYGMANTIGLRPAPYIDVPMRLSGALMSKQPGQEGYAEEASLYGPGSIGQMLPLTGAIQGATAYAGIGGPTGVDIEAPARKLLGLPEGEQWDAYRIARGVSDIAAEQNAAAMQQGTRFDRTPYLAAQELIKAHGQTDLPSMLRTYTPDRVASELQINQTLATQALEIARAAALQATKQRGFASLASFVGGTRAQQLPEGEQMRLAMREAEKGAGYNAITGVGSRAEAQQVQKAFPALEVQRSQYGALPGDEKEYSYLLDRALRDQVDQQFDALKTAVLQAKPWDRRSARAIEAARWQAKQRMARGGTAGDTAWQEDYMRAMANITGAKMPDMMQPASEYRALSLAGATPEEATQIRRDEAMRQIMQTQPLAENFIGEDGQIDFAAYRQAADTWRKNLPTIAAGIPAIGAIVAKADSEGRGPSLRRWLDGLNAEAVDAYRRRNDDPLEAFQRVYFERMYQPAMDRYRELQDAGDPDAWTKTVGALGPVSGDMVVDQIRELYPRRFNEEQLAQVAQMSMPPAVDVMRSNMSEAAARKDKARSGFWDFMRNMTPPGGDSYKLREIPLVAAALDQSSRATLTEEQYKLAGAMAAGWISETYGQVTPELQAEWAAARQARQQLDLTIVSQFGRAGLSRLSAYDAAANADAKEAVRKQWPEVNQILAVRQAFARGNEIYAKYYRNALPKRKRSGFSGG